MSIDQRKINFLDIFGFESKSDDDLRRYAQSLTFEQVIAFSQNSDKFNKVINTEEFWEKRLNSDFPDAIKILNIPSFLSKEWYIRLRNNSTLSLAIANDEVDIVKYHLSINNKPILTEVDRKNINSSDDDELKALFAK